MAQPSDDEEEDLDLKRAIALSLGLDPTAINSQASVKTPVKALAMDRKTMERERLARLAARKRDASVSPPSSLATDARSWKRAKLAPTAVPIADSFRHSNTQSPVASSTLKYPQGVIKKTWSKAHPRDSQDITIEEVLQKDELKTGLFSSFMWDSEWFFSKVDTNRTRMILAMQAKSEEEQAQLEQDAREQGFANVRVCCPPLRGPYTCMHSKLMLLFYADSLRIVVPTANLTEYDWGETGVMENAVFLLDLPRREEGDQERKENLTFFGRDLLYFLEHMGLPENFIQGVLNFDFSKTKHLAFVHSVHGPHYDADIERNGFPGLSRAVRTLGLQSEESLELDFASSSIGSLNDLTINNLYEAARGTPVASFDQKKFKASNTNTKSRFRIYFPTHETVSNSLGGLQSAGTVCLQEKYFSKPDFPRCLFRDYRSTRPNLLSHNKLLFARGIKDDGSKEAVAWVYVGSANLSESAWGRLVVDRSRKAPKLTCNNWECGVLFAVSAKPLDVDASCLQRDSSANDLESVFGGSVPVPFQCPGKKYGDKSPWYFMNATR